MASERATLLICTVGGAADPVIASIRYWRPSRAWFVHTPQTRHVITETIVPGACDDAYVLDAGRRHFLELRDGEDLTSCLDQLRRLTPEVAGWTANGDGYRVVVDFTSGTKCMSAALALQARRWRCVYSYVGGTERSKEGTGVVVPGAERVVHHANPLDAMGYQAIDDFRVLFDQGAYFAAAKLAEETKKGVERGDRKREFAVLEHLANGFDAWDRFDHRSTITALEDVQNAANDLRGALGFAVAERVLEFVGRWGMTIRQLGDVEKPTSAHVVDLLANALRRQREGRYEDAAARLYRAVEAIAQVALHEDHGVASTDRVPLEHVPGSLRLQWQTRAKNGCVKLGLQDAYALLGAYGDPLAQKFRKLGLDSPQSPLSARNRSVLAHGFERVSNALCTRLSRAACELAGVPESNLPAFPRLGDPPR